VQINLHVFLSDFLLKKMFRIISFALKISYEIPCKISSVRKILILYTILYETRHVLRVLYIMIEISILFAWKLEKNLVSHFKSDVCTLQQFDRNH